MKKRTGIEALCRKPNTAQPAPGHKGYPYLLSKQPITCPNHLWPIDVSSMARRRISLAALPGCFSGRVFAWVGNHAES